MTNTINTNTNTYYGGDATQFKKVVSTNPELNKYADRLNLNDPDMPVVDLAEYAAEKLGFPDKEAFLEYVRKSYVSQKSENKTVEINGQTYNADDIPIAKVDLAEKFTPTGDPEQDRKLAAKYGYFDSCTDYTNSGDYAEMTANEDFSGMSAAEIYKEIFEKYRHCYGENFLETGAVRYWTSPLVRKFNSEIEEKCGTAYYSEEIQQAHRELLYGKATNSEVRRKILEKYTENGNITVRNLFKAVNEMCLSGVADGGLGGIYDTVLDRIESNTDNVDEYYNEDHEGLLISKLDNYITAKDCQKMLKNYQSRAQFQGAGAEQGAAIKQIIEACSGGYGSVRQIGISIEKMSSSSERAKASLTWLKI